MKRGRPPKVPLHGHATVLDAVLASLCEPTSTRELARRLGWPKSAVVNAMSNLRKRHLVYSFDLRWRANGSR